MGTDLPEQNHELKQKSLEDNLTMMVSFSPREQRLFLSSSVKPDSHSRTGLPELRLSFPAESPAGKALEEGINSPGMTSRKTMGDALEPSYEALFSKKKDTTDSNLRELVDKLPQFAYKAATAQDSVVMFAGGIAHSLCALASRELAARTGKEADRKDAQRSTEAALTLPDGRVPTLNHAFHRALSDYMRDREVDAKSFAGSVQRISDLAEKSLKGDERLDTNNAALPLLGILAEAIKGQTGENRGVAEKAYKELARAIKEEVSKEKPADRKSVYAWLRAINGLGTEGEVARLTGLMEQKSVDAPLRESEPPREAEQVLESSGKHAEKTKEVVEAANAVRSGNIDKVKIALKNANAQANGDDVKFRKFSVQLAKELERDGYIVKFPPEGEPLIQVVLGHKNTPLSVDFRVVETREGTVVKAQSYDSRTQKVVVTDPQTVIRGFRLDRATETKPPAKDLAELDKARDNKPKTKARAELEQTAERTYEEKDFESFKKNLDKFEAHAKENKLSAQEIAKTLEATRGLIDAPNKYFSKDERAKLAFQAIRQAGDETTIDQGRNPTCNATVVEKMLYSRQPSRPLEMLRDIATTGKFKTVEGTEVALKPDELKADAEGIPLHTQDAKRSYASQIAQTVLINAVWSIADTRPDGVKVPPGSIRYEKRPPNRADANDTGDRLVDNSKKPPEVIAEKDGKPITHPHINLPKMVRMWKQVTGETPPHFAVVRSEEKNEKSYYPHFGLHVVSSAEELQSMLKKHGEGSDGQRFPIILTLHDVGQLEGKANAPGRSHGVTIKGVEIGKDGKMMIHIDNQWGKTSDNKYPIDTVFRAMRPKPVEKKR